MSKKIKISINPRHVFYVVSITLVLIALVLGILEKKSIEDQKWELERFIRKYSRFIEKNKGLRSKESDILKAVKNLEINSVRGETQAIALTKLQNIVNEKAEKAGLDVRSVRSLGAKKVAENWYVIAVRVDFKGDGKGLIDFLFSVESSIKPYIFVDKLDISVFSVYRKGLKIRNLRGYIVAKSFWFSYPKP